MRDYEARDMFAMTEELIGKANKMESSLHPRAGDAQAALVRSAGLFAIAGAVIHLADAVRDRETDTPRG